MNLSDKPNFDLEKKCWRRGLKYVAGLDEVGRGSFAGPVVAGCVVFDKKIEIPGKIHIDDSKKLTPKRRKKAEAWIKENAAFYSVGKARVSIINKKGIGRATNTAFRRAVRKVNKMAGGRIEYLFIDAFYVPYLRDFPAAYNARQEAVESGDSRSISIAAASIIAKEYRDSLMKRLAKKGSYKHYAWHKNKGYGTKEHREALRKHGQTKHHRVQFVENYI